MTGGTTLQRASTLLPQRCSLQPLAAVAAMQPTCLGFCSLHPLAAARYITAACIRVLYRYAVCIPHCSHFKQRCTTLLSPIISSVLNFLLLEKKLGYKEGRGAEGGVQRAVVPTSAKSSGHFGGGRTFQPLQSALRNGRITATFHFIIVYNVYN